MQQNILGKQRAWYCQLHLPLQIVYPVKTIPATWIFNSPLSAINILRSLLNIVGYLHIKTNTMGFCKEGKVHAYRYTLPSSSSEDNVTYAASCLAPFGCILNRREVEGFWCSLPIQYSHLIPGFLLLNSWSYESLETSDPSLESMSFSISASFLVSEWSTNTTYIKLSWLHIFTLSWLQNQIQCITMKSQLVTEHTKDTCSDNWTYEVHFYCFEVVKTDACNTKASLNVCSIHEFFFFHFSWPQCQCWIHSSCPGICVSS